MAHAEKELFIKRPALEIFDFLADGTNDPKWRPGVVSISLKEGSTGALGATYQQTLRGPGGRNIEGDYKLIAVQKSSELGFIVVTGPARPEGHYYLTPEGDGTKVKFVLDFQPKGLAKLMDPIITKTMQGEVGNLENLKQFLEK